MEIRLRIPEWSKVSSLRVNDAPVPDPTPGAYAVIDQPWSGQDRVRLRLDMSPRVIGPKMDGLQVFSAVR